MDDTKLNKTEYCLGCLCHSDEFNLQCYQFKTETLKTLFQVECLYFCYICKSLVHKAELFLQNVQSNQIFLDNFQNITDATIATARIQYSPLIALSKELLDTVEVTNTKEDTDEGVFTTYSKCKDVSIEIKLELKEEGVLDNLEDDFIEDNDFQESIIKEEEQEEDDFLIKSLIKVENTEPLNDVSQRKVKKTSKRSNVKKKTHRNEEEIENIDSTIKMIHITREQCMRERSKMMKDPKYINSVFKCEDCVKGFTFKESYVKHMEKHSEEMGEYECDICKQRMGTMEKLLSHQRYHRIRYKCTECELTRICRLTIKDHYTAFHHQNPFQYRCSHCSKMFKRQVSLRKHVALAHVKQKRSKCKYCQKTYSSKESLKIHLICKHSPEVSPGRAPAAAHACPQCGAAFAAPSRLASHMLKHSAARDFYCVECDRSFKSHNALKQHLKIAAPHVNYTELPFQCAHCEKKFSVRRDLERHRNRVHLNIRPYQCDKCDKAYVNASSLTEHRRFTHDGHKRPLKFPCTLCDKVFDRNATRKAHIRTHTGERPYGCDKCPARFSQASVLGTHVKLVHLKLTRDGRPKAPLPVK